MHRELLVTRLASLALLVLVGAVTACAPSDARTGTVPSRAAGEAAGQKPAAERGLQVGQRAPDFLVTTLQGRPLTSTDLLAQDKPFVLYFFASW